jgi:ADP-ribosylglycohydrolase
MLPKNKIASATDEETVKKAIIVSMREYGRKYPGAGYGASFMNWLDLPEPEPYGSWGNGSAMRASFAGWAAKSLDEAEKLGEISAAVTHDHPDGIKGAKVVAGIIYLLRNGADKMGVHKYASGFYNMDFKLDDIRDLYCFDVSCTGTVPPAIRAFLEGKNFAEVISLAISLGGDSDTLAAIAASMAEVIYPMPTELCRRTISKLDGFLLGTLISAVRFITER